MSFKLNCTVWRWYVKWRGIELLPFSNIVVLSISVFMASFGWYVSVARFDRSCFLSARYNSQAQSKHQLFRIFSLICCSHRLSSNAIRFVYFVILNGNHRLPTTPSPALPPIARLPSSAAIAHIQSVAQFRPS